MPKKKEKTLKLTNLTQIQGLSKPQKLFNKLIKHIEKKRQELLSWKNMLAKYKQKYSTDWEPVLAVFNEHRVALIHLFDEAYSTQLLNKKEKAKISDIVCNIITELPTHHHDDQLKELYTKHSGSDLDEEVAAENNLMKQMMEDMLGVDLDDDIDFQSSADIIKNISKKINEKTSQDNEKPAKRKKSAAAIARDQKREADEKNISQSIREVYRKLSSALHPDREQDPVERDKKTLMMQLVNVAYQNNDLLSLLELQLEIEQIDQHIISSISEEKVKHYNQILSAQLNEIGTEINGIHAAFHFHFAPMSNIPLSPKTAMPYLESTIKILKQDLNSIQQDLTTLKEIKMLKSYLKTYQIAQTDQADPRHIFDFLRP